MQRKLSSTPTSNDRRFDFLSGFAKRLIDLNDLDFLYNKEPLSAKKIHKALKEKTSERSFRNDLLE
jgi:hypothetical protein